MPDQSPVNHPIISIIGSCDFQSSDSLSVNPEAVVFPPVVL
jgi:hypothetical protein